MAITIITPVNSFVRFNEPAPVVNCIWGTIDYCLPVYEEGDVFFQFVIQGTEAEIDSLCTDDAAEVELSLIPECDGEALLVFSEKPGRIRLSTTQILYTWSHGFPGFAAVVAEGRCFKVQVEISSLYGSDVLCSNCFERIADECYTSVIEYGDDTDSFGFKYCNSGDIEGEAVGQTCDPTIVNFINEATLAIPYTAGLQAKYGDMPTVQAWIYDGVGQLVNMGITITFDGYPATMINLDFGGTASGIVVIR